MDRYSTAAVLLVLTLLVAACDHPLPGDRSDYAGQWQGRNVSLSITPDGHVSYHRDTGNGGRSIDAPLKRFDGDDFVVGVGFLTTTFKVTAPPHADGAGWTMTVDGTTLHRVDGDEDTKSSGDGA